MFPESLCFHNIEIDTKKLCDLLISHQKLVKEVGELVVDPAV